MIVGVISDLKRYVGLNKNLDKAIDYILKEDLFLLPLGKTVINENIYLNKEEYFPKDLEDCELEGHNNYLDIQIVLEGIEGMGYTNCQNSNLIISKPYNLEKDVTKYETKLDTIFEMKNLMYAIVFPEDLHMPKIKINNNNNLIKKVVVKVKME